MEPSAASNVVQYLAGSGGVAAFAILLYVARLVFKGDLVVRSVEEREARLIGLVEEGQARERVVAEVCAEAQARERIYGKVINEGREQLGRIGEQYRNIDSLLRGQRSRSRDPQ